MRSLRSSLATTSSAPSSIFLRPIFQVSATRNEYCSMVSGSVVGTISTATWLPFLASKFRSVWFSEAISSLESVPVWSTTRPTSGGTATSAKAAKAQHSSSARMQALAAFIAGQPMDNVRECLPASRRAAATGTAARAAAVALAVAWTAATARTASRIRAVAPRPAAIAESRRCGLGEQHHQERKDGGDHRQQPDADHKPCDQRDEPRHHDRGGKPAESGTQYGADHEQSNQDKGNVKKIKVGAVKPWLRLQRRGRRRQRLTFDYPDDPGDARENPAGKIAASKARRDDLVDDAFRGGVGQRAFEPVADLDAKLAVVLGDDKQRAVVDLLATDLPGFRDPQRILLDGLGLSGRHDQHRDLAAFPRLEIPQRLVQRGDFVAGKRPGPIDDPPDQRRHRDVGKGRKGPAQHQCKKGSSCSVHRRGQSSAPAPKFANIRGILKDELRHRSTGCRTILPAQGPVD